MTEAAKTASFTYDFIKDTGELSRLEGYPIPDDEFDGWLWRERGGDD